MKTSSSRYAQCLYFSSGALARKVEKLAVESWKKIALSPSHAYLLLAVLDEPGIQPGTLAEHLQLQPSTVTRLMEKLELKKLIVRTSEGKVTNVYPSPKAKELQPRMMECMETFARNYEALLGREDSERLVKAITRMADKLTD